MNHLSAGPSASLRNRLTREIMGAIVILIVAFAATVLGAICVHLYHDARRDAKMTFANFESQNRVRRIALIDTYARPTDPRIWVLRYGRVVTHSPNGTRRPISPRRSGLIWHPVPVFQWSARDGRLMYVIDWPLTSDLTLLRGLVTALGIVTMMAAGAGNVIAKWTTNVVLKPVRMMTDGVQMMLDTQSIQPIPLPPGHDEFAKLASLFNRLLIHVERRRQEDRALLADAAHQLRTPLEVVRGNLEIVRRWENLDSSLRDECLTAIDRTVVEMSRLVRDLLTMEQVSSAIGGTRVAPLALPQLLQEIGEDASALIVGQPGFVVGWRVAPELAECSVIGNEDFARRALWAITENALKYSDPKHGRVHFELCIAPDKYLCGVRVSDNGPGIPPDELPHVFTRFYRGSQVQGISGAGLGLSMAQALMAAQGGEIEIQSNEFGTTVTLWFRVAD